MYSFFGPHVSDPNSAFRGTNAPGESMPQPWAAVGMRPTHGQANSQTDMVVTSAIAPLVKNSMNQTEVDDNVANALTNAQGEPMFSMPGIDNGLPYLATISAINLRLQRERRLYNTPEAVKQHVTYVGIYMDRTGEGPSFGMDGSYSMGWTDRPGDVVSMHVSGTNHGIVNLWTKRGGYSTYNHTPVLEVGGKLTVGTRVGLAVIPFSFRGLYDVAAADLYPSADELVDHLHRARTRAMEANAIPDICFQIVPVSTNTGMFPTDRQLTGLSPDEHGAKASCFLACIGVVSTGGVASFPDSHSNADVLQYTTRRRGTDSVKPDFIHVVFTDQIGTRKRPFNYMLQRRRCDPDCDEPRAPREPEAVSRRASERSSSHSRGAAVPSAASKKRGGGRP